MLEKLFGIHLEEERALRRMRARADGVMVVVCWLLWLCSLCFALLHREWVAALGVGTPLALAASAVARWMPGRFRTRMLIAFVFMAFSGLLIHETHGLIESHFSIFALLAFLLYYRDWRPILMAAVTIAVHHLAVCALEMRGWAVYVFPAGHPCDMVWVHAGYVVAEALVLVYLAGQIRREALETTAISRFSERLTQTGVIDLRVAKDGEYRSEALERLLSAINGVVSRNVLVAGNMSSVSGNVLETAGKVLHAGKEQALSSESAVSALARMAGTADEVAQHCHAISEVARGSAAVVEEGRRTMGATARTMESLVGSVLNVSREMQGLYAESTRIEGIIRIMSDIARQTDLLALNATIEAAGAGAAGRGFHVVAQEIRELSTRTHASLREAQGMVDQVRDQTRRMGDLTEHCQKEAQEGGRQVKELNGRLEQVVLRLPQITAEVGGDDGAGKALQRSERGRGAGDGGDQADDCGELEEPAPDGCAGAVAGNHVRRADGEREGVSGAGGLRVTVLMIGLAELASCHPERRNSRSLREFWSRRTCVSPRMRNAGPSTPFGAKGAPNSAQDDNDQLETMMVRRDGTTTKCVAALRHRLLCSGFAQEAVAEGDGGTLDGEVEEGA